jgi:hypothetical protein
MMLAVLSRGRKTEPLPSSRNLGRKGTCEFKNPVKAQPLLLNLERPVVAKLRAAREQAEGRTSSRSHPLDAEGRPKVTARLFSRTHAARSSSE